MDQETLGIFAIIGFIIVIVCAFIDDGKTR